MTLLIDRSNKQKTGSRLVDDYRFQYRQWLQIGQERAMLSHGVAFCVHGLERSQRVRMEAFTMVFFGDRWWIFIHNNYRRPAYSYGVGEKTEFVSSHWRRLPL